MTRETKHLLYWQFEWFRRFIVTSYHLVNRKAYHKYKRNTGKFNNKACRELFPDLEGMEENDFF